MLHCSTIEPESTFSALDEQTSASEDSNLGVVRILDIVISGPEPGVLKVKTRRARRDMHAQECSNAVRVRSGWYGLYWTL